MSNNLPPELIERGIHLLDDMERHEAVRALTYVIQHAQTLLTNLESGDDINGHAAAQLTADAATASRRVFALDAIQRTVKLIGPNG